jgi:hypothetical protein
MFGSSALGSKTEVAALRRDVRSAPDGGHRRSVRLTTSALSNPTAVLFAAIVALLMALAVMVTG